MKSEILGQLAKMQGCIDQLYVISTRVDARIDGVIEIAEQKLGSAEAAKLKETLVRHEFARMDAFLLLVELAEPQTARRMRSIFNRMMQQEGKL